MKTFEGSNKLLLPRLLHRLSVALIQHASRMGTLCADRALNGWSALSLPISRPVTLGA